MRSVTPCPLPDAALLNVYRRDGGYADCYRTDIALPASLAQFVEAFYTTPVFKLERAILKWALSMPSTDAQAAQLAAGTGNSFAAWRVEKRAQDQLLLCPVGKRTRSWLMVAPCAAGTRLYFGSAVVPARNSRTGRGSLGAPYRALLGFHRLYSRILLHAARSRLEARHHD
ncbi:MAG: hypothetical protein ABI423_07865 [Burkholderiales bacterium]